jgi:hypothetical protein
MVEAGEALIRFAAIFFLEGATRTRKLLRFFNIFRPQLFFWR